MKLRFFSTGVLYLTLAFIAAVIGIVLHQLVGTPANFFRWIMEEPERAGICGLLIVIAVVLAFLVPKAVRNDPADKDDSAV